MSAKPEKTQTPGVYRRAGPKRTTYIVMYNVRIADEKAKSGSRYTSRGKTFSKYADAVRFKIETLNALHNPRTLEITVSNPTIYMPLAGLFGPCVYLLKEAGSEEVLYIGMSMTGVRRLSNSHHRGVEQAKRHRDVLVKLFFFSDVKAAAELESALILKHRPKYNINVDLRYVRRRDQKTIIHERELEIL